LVNKLGQDIIPTNMLYGIWLVIELGRDILPTNIFTKFDDDPLKNVQVTDRPRFLLAILANSRAISPKWLIGSGWLSNLADHIYNTAITLEPFGQAKYFMHIYMP